MQSDSFLSQETNGLSNMIPPATGSSHINVGAAERVISALAGGALAALGLRKITSPSGIAMAVAGGLLLHRGLTGYCMVNNAIGRNTNTSTSLKSAAIEIQQVFQIDKSPQEVYSFWRKLENLPLFMKHLKKVEEFDSKHSTWTAHLPGHVGSVSWKAMIDQDIPNDTIAWSSLPGSTIDNTGEVRFKDSFGGTELRVKMSYRLPAGELGTVAAKLVNPAVEKMINEDLKRFKEMMEGGKFAIADTYTSSTVSTAYESGSTFGERTTVSSPSDTPARKQRPRKKPDMSSNKPIEQTSEFPDPDVNSSYDNKF